MFEKSPEEVEELEPTWKLQVIKTSRTKSEGLGVGSGAWLGSEHT